VFEVACVGTFRRRVQVATRALSAGRLEARCALEDDFHHFRVCLEASDGVVSAVRTSAYRSPNSLCEAAGHQLQELVGMALDPASAAVLKRTDQFQQCTHQLDLAGLGVAGMALERPRRNYEITIPDRQNGHTIARLDVDGQTMLVWQVKGMTLEGPTPFEGRSLGAGFTEFTSSLARDEAEAALVLRRALFVSQGRRLDLATLGDRGPVGGCWAWQPERIARLERLPENRRDYSDDAQALLVGDAEWLDFRA
jgi:hypothetical protein